MSQKSIVLIFPNQLFREHPLLKKEFKIVLIEEDLFFRQYHFHVQKLTFHRASMKAYQQRLEKIGYSVDYIDSDSEYADLRNFKGYLKQHNVTRVFAVEPADFYLEKRLRAACCDIDLEIVDSLLFINNKKDLSKFFDRGDCFYFQTDFYKQERVRLHILIDVDKKPNGGKWTFDQENRKKFPSRKVSPALYTLESSAFWTDAEDYVKKQFPDAKGEEATHRLFPVTHKEAQDWLQQFLDYRFYEFGTYEDAIVANEALLYHSLLSPLLNVGLLLPHEVLEKTLAFARENEIPLNSVEGFVRQIIGWREFMHGMYQYHSVAMRNQNFFNHQHPIPAAFYEGTTGVQPIDHTIKKVLKHGYAHHIERLMILGNFMLLCEIHPEAVYQWFMELFIDSYDWVMVPNIFGMSQFADGGSFATKPYISSSNYVKKMSDYQQGDWEAIWDGLFWRFVNKNQQYFKNQPRVSMIYYTWQRMDESKKAEHLKNAGHFLKTLHQS